MKCNKVVWARDDDGMAFWDTCGVALRVVSGTCDGFEVRERRI